MHQVVMIAYEGGADIIDIAGPMDVFATANEILAMSGKKAFYKLHVLAEEVGACATACGIKIVQKHHGRLGQEDRYAAHKRRQRLPLSSGE